MGRSTKQYEQVWEDEGPNGFSKWRDLPKFEELSQCCGCGHTHHVQYKVKDGVLWYRCKTLKRETKRLRALMMKACEGVFGAMLKA